MNPTIRSVTPWRLALVAIMIGLTYMIAMQQPIRDWYSNWDKLAHVVAFFAIYIALMWSLNWRTWLVVFLASLIGAAVEVHQAFMPGFSPSLLDWLADIVGIMIGILVSKRICASPKHP